MAEQSIEIDRYSLSRMSDFSNVRATIWLMDEKDAPIGRIEFRLNDVPQKIQMRPEGYPNVYYSIDAYPDVVDILRNEDPVYLVYSESMGYARVSTSSTEPVGEAE